MSGFEHQVKKRTYELKNLFNKGFSAVSNSVKKGWYKVKNIKR